MQKRNENPMTPYENKTVKDLMKEEKKKLKGMPLKDKIWYIWEYYKIPIIGTIVGVLMAVSIGHTVYMNRFETALSSVILKASYNFSDPSAVDDYFNVGFRDYMGLDENTKITIDYSMSLNFEEEMSDPYAYAEMAKITALVAAKDLDVIIAPADVMEHYAVMDSFLRLDQVLPEDLYSQVEDMIYTAAVTETGEEVQCGIRLSETDFMEDTGLTIEDPILGIVSNSNRSDAGITLIRYILDQSE